MTHHRFGEGIVEPYRGVLVDSMLMALARHHAETADDVAAIIDYCAILNVQAGQLDILLRHLGRRIPLMAETVEVSRADWDGAIKAPGTLMVKSTFADGALIWNGRHLRIVGRPVPETVVDALPGRPLSTLIEHPYLPRDVVIRRAHQDPIETVVTLAGEEPPRSG